MDNSTRFISKDGSVRGAAVVATELVREIVAIQRPPQTLTGLLGELAVGTLLTRLMMAPDLRVQATLQWRPRGSLFIDSFPDGSTRGLANIPADSSAGLGPDVLLQITRILDNGELQTGTVATAPGKGLSASFTTYMMSSEQTTSSFQLGCIVEDDEVVAAGGWILQVLPDHDEVFVAAALNRIEEAADIDILLRDAVDSADIFNANMAPLPFREIGTTELRFGCNCSQDRIIRALGTLSPEELAEIRASKEVISADCDYCGTIYNVHASEL